MALPSRVPWQGPDGHWSPTLPRPLELTDPVARPGPLPARLFCSPTCLAAGCRAVLALLPCFKDPERVADWSLLGKKGLEGRTPKKTSKG